MGLHTVSSLAKYTDYLCEGTTYGARGHALTTTHSCEIHTRNQIPKNCACAVFALSLDSLFFFKVVVGWCLVVVPCHIGK